MVAFPETGPAEECGISNEVKKKEIRDILQLPKKKTEIQDRRFNFVMDLIDKRKDWRQAYRQVLEEDARQMVANRLSQEDTETTAEG